MRAKSSRGTHGGANTRLENLCRNESQGDKVKDPTTWSLLEWAVRANHAVVVKVLGDHCLPDNCNAIHLAAERGNLDIVQILLQLQMSSVSSQDTRGRTALMRAIECSREKVVLFLMSKTAARRLLKVTPSGMSLLHLCAISGLEDAIATMIGCLVQLERKLKGDEALNLHDFINQTDSHPDLIDYDSEDEELNNEEDGGESKSPKRSDELPTTGFTPFEYSLMFGNGAIALRLAYGSTQSMTRASVSPAISLNPRFPGAAGYFLPVMSASIRAMLSEFFNDPSRSQDHGPNTIRGDFIRHPSHSQPNDDDRWPKEKNHIRFSRLTWPDVRAIGIANLSKTKWVAEKLSEILTVEHEKSRYSSLLSCLDLQGRAFRLNTGSLVDLPATNRLTVFQHLASLLVVHRYTSRDHDWTSTTGAISEDCLVVGVKPSKKKKPTKKDDEDAKERIAVAADGLVSQISCVQLEFVADVSRVRVVVDAEGVVHEKFSFVDNQIICGDLDVAIEAHFRRKERIAKSNADDVLREVMKWMKTSNNQLLMGMRVSVDWRAVDKYRFDSPQDRIKCFEMLSSNRGIWNLVQSLKTIALPEKKYLNARQVPPFSGITFRRAAWSEGDFFVTEDVNEAAKAAGNSELTILYDVKGGNAYFSKPSKALSPLFIHHEFDCLRRLMTAKQDSFTEGLSDLLPGIKCKFELEGTWKIHPGGADLLHYRISNLLKDVSDLLRHFTKAEETEGDESMTEWAELNKKGDQQFSLSNLYETAIRQHIKSFGILVSPRREPTVKLAASSKTAIVCVQVNDGEIAVPGPRQLMDSFYYSVIEIEANRLQEMMHSTMADAQHRLMTYLPTTSLTVDWRSFDSLDSETRFLAIGLFSHSRGAKVLQPLISGLSVGWDSKLGGFVRKNIKQIFIHCTRGWKSHTKLDGEGNFHVYVALLSAVTNKNALMTAQEMATDIIIHLEGLTEKELKLEDLVNRAIPQQSTQSKLIDHIDPSNAFPCWCWCFGESLREAEAGTNCTFMIKAHNILNNPCTAVPGIQPNEPFAVKIINIRTKDTIPVTVTPPPKGSDSSLYKVKYTAPGSVGMYNILATLNGIPLAQTPTRLRISCNKTPEDIKTVGRFPSSIVSCLPVILTFKLIDFAGNQCRRIRSSFQQGEEVSIKSDATAIRKSLHRHHLCDSSVEQYFGETGRVISVAREVGVVNLQVGEKPNVRVIPLPADCIEGNFLKFEAKTHNSDMTVGDVVSGLDGTFSVRVLASEVGDSDITINVTGGEVDLTLEKNFNVISARAALDAVAEDCLYPWERKMRDAQKTRWEKANWNKWKKKGKRPRRANWEKTLRKGGRDDDVGADEWMQFRRMKNIQIDTDVGIPKWWRRQNFGSRKELMESPTIRLPYYQQKMFMRIAVQPQEISRSLLRKVTKALSNVNERSANSKKQDVRRAVADSFAIPDLPVFDKYLQELLDRNGGGRAASNVVLPTLTPPAIGNEEETRIRKTDAIAIHPLMAVSRS